jgi:hypothetical protein
MSAANLSAHTEAALLLQQLCAARSVDFDAAYGCVDWYNYPEPKPQAAERLAALPRLEPLAPARL